MFDKILDLFMKFRFSKWWYLLIAIFLYFCYQLLDATKKKSEAKYIRIQNIILLALGIPIFILILLAAGLFIYLGPLGDLANDLSMVMITSLAVLLLLIPLIYKLLHKKAK